MEDPRPAPLLSVVVPVRNEAENIGPLIAEIRASLEGTSRTKLSMWTMAATMRRRTCWRARHRRGRLRSCVVVIEPAAAKVPRSSQASRRRTAAWIATLDGDGQNDPADIPALFTRALVGAGDNPDRRDIARPAATVSAKRLASRAANRIRAGLLGDATPDTGCGLKVFQPRCVSRIYQRSITCIRYLPALFHLGPADRVISVPVNHRPRTRGHSNYGTLDRLWVGIFDLIGVAWLQRRWRRPVVESPGGSETH